MTQATAAGSHYWGGWDRCQRLSYYRHQAPTLDGGIGLSPRWGEPPLLRGTAVHAALAAYYQRYAEGHHDPDAALEALQASFEKDRHQWADPDKYDSEYNKSRILISRYCEWYGPGGRGDETKDLQVLSDTEGPLVERYLEVPVGPGIPNYTCRPDLLVVWHGWPYVLEHKTSKVNFVTRLLRSMETDIQSTGECFTIASLGLGEMTGVLVNVLVTERAERSTYAPFLRDPKSRSQAQLEAFRTELVTRWEQREERTARYQRLLGEGLDPYEAARRVYVRTGFTTGACFDYGRECPFLSMCTNPGQEHRLLGSFRATDYEEKEETQ